MVCGERPFGLRVIRVDTLHHNINTWWLVYLILQLTEPVSLQVKVEGFMGDSVILPCLYKEKVLKAEETDVFWRYNKIHIVYDILNSRPSLEKQDTLFRNRTESFPSEYVNGNFSLKLKHLEYSHAGQYSCFIAEPESEQILKLVVRGKNVSTSGSNGEARNSSMQEQPKRIINFIIAVLGFFLHHI